MTVVKIVGLGWGEVCRRRKHRVQGRETNGWLG